MSDVKFFFGQIAEGPGELCHCVDGKPHHHYLPAVWNGARWVPLSSEEGKSIIDALAADPDNIEDRQAVGTEQALADVTFRDLRFPLVVP